ncbi:MAG: hypothetical protein ACRC7N_14615 [Clostridium sp.]
MKTNGYTQIPNSILLNKDISSSAIRIYAILINLSTRKDFKIYRDYVKSVSGLGETAFRRAWKELKDLNLLEMDCKREKGKFNFDFSLKGNTINKFKNEIAKTFKKNKKAKAPVVKNEAVQAEAMDHSEEDIQNIESVTGFTKEKAIELINAAKNDVAKVINGYNYATQKSGVKNLFKYTLWAIKNNMGLIKNNINKPSKKLNFNNFEAREYDWDVLERRLLGWDKSDTKYDLSYT